MAQTINVNTTPGQFMPTLYYSQGDIGREFEIVLASSDGWSIPAGATVEMVATKPSGFGFSVAGTLTDNVASFTTTETMTNEHGRYPAEIRITSGTDVIGTANFYLSGERDPHPAETIDGDASEIIPELTLLVERVEAAASSVLDMTVNASTLSAGSQATYSYDEETNTATFGIPQGEAGAGAAGVTASAYSSSRTYAVGDYVIHNSNLYRCTTAITTAESFTAGHWTQVVLADDVTDVKSNLTTEASQMENGTTLAYPLGALTFANTADGRVKCTSEELQEGDVVYLSDTANYQLALSTQNGASLYGWFTGPIVMTATRRYVAIRKSDSSNIQSLPSGEFSRLIHVIRKAEYYQDLIQRSDDEAEQGNYILYNAGDLPFAPTSDNRVKCSTVALNVGDVVHLLDTTNYRIGISQANGGSPYGWFTDPVTITATRKYVIFKDANNADISSMLNLDVSKLIYVTRKSNYQKQIDGIKNSYKFAHISFDDVRYCMEDITANAGTYTSVFQNPFLAKLKEWHETYGAVFSLYLFSENMGNYTTAFASEFADNADWLKFGFHSVNANSNFENTTAAQAESAYSAFVDDIISITGTVEAIDRLPRLGNFKGNLESMLAIRDCKCGVVGALSAYDTRDSYYLSSADSAYVKDHGKLYDATNYMTFFRTIMTMEVTNPSTSLPALLTKAEYNNSDYLIGMMHEYEIYTSSYALVSSMADRIEYACDWAVEHEYDWDFPMHRQ